MSGIAVVIGSENQHLVHRMLEKLRHRGPDGSWTYAGNGIVAGCTNLAVDSHAVRQLRHNGCDEICVVADAQVYNREELRGSLSDHTCDTSSDVELILNLYREYGPSFVKRIDGIFALAVSDKGKVFIARDPLGVKPLYWAQENGCRYFASELKALAGESRNVSIFPPGHYYDSEQGFVKYYDFDEPESKSAQAGKMAKQLLETLDEAVIKRLPSDGDVGILLSGGLDSSTVGVLAAKHASNVHSFTSGTEQSEDVKHARALAERLGTRHHEYIYSIPEMLEILPQVIYYLESFDYLLVRSSIANYIASKMAGDYVKVVLCGEGSDELFAGYDYLTECESDADLSNTLRDMVFGCYNTGLRRVDRMNMASSIEGRMPYFDRDLMEFAFTVPACYKVHPDTKTEKWLVRKAFEDHLPNDITWRKKAKFSIGAGSYELMTEVANEKISDKEFEAERTLSNDHVLRNKEELMYYRIFADYFGDSPEVLDTVGITPVA